MPVLAIHVTPRPCVRRHQLTDRMPAYVIQAGTAQTVMSTSMSVLKVRLETNTAVTRMNLSNDQCFDRSIDNSYRVTAALQLFSCVPV
jgi:hypothetical protein